MIITPNRSCLPALLHRLISALDLPLPSASVPGNYRPFSRVFPIQMIQMGLDSRNRSEGTPGCWIVPAGREETCRRKPRPESPS